jgi:hypothetical protein
MSKLVSFILVLVLFFGSVVNSFADTTEDAPILAEIGIVVGALAIGGLLIWGLVYLIGRDMGYYAEVKTPDDDIRLVSSENEAPRVTTDNKTILNVLKHVEAGVTPNKDIYVGLRFQY